jgi:hypothetical protein
MTATNATQMIKTFGGKEAAVLAVGRRIAAREERPVARRGSKWDPGGASVCWFFIVVYVASHASSFYRSTDRTHFTMYPFIVT